MDRTDPPAPVVDPAVRLAPRPAAFATAAGITGVLANALLLGFFGLLAADSPAADVTGPANDLVGSLSCALMVPVAVALRRLLPRRRAVGIAEAVGIAAMSVLAVGGPLLVLGIVPFEIQTPVSIGASMLLAGWLFLVNRWMRRAGTLRPALARAGQLIGAATLAAGAGVGAALVLLPRASTAQIVVLVVAGLPGVLAWLATPVWFLRLGNRRASLPSLSPSSGPDRRLQGAES